MQEKSKEYNEKEQQVAENRSRNTLFERRENLQKHESYASERRQYDAIRNGQTDRIQSVFQITPDGTPEYCPEMNCETVRICLSQELRCLPELRLKVAYLKKLLMH